MQGVLDTLLFLVYDYAMGALRFRRAADSSKFHIPTNRSCFDCIVSPCSFYRQLSSNLDSACTPPEQPFLSKEASRSKKCREKSKRNAQGPRSHTDAHLER